MSELVGEMSKSTEKNKMAAQGSLLTIIGGILWGFSGSCGQYLMETKGLNPNWIVTFRLLSAGFILLAICYLRNKNKIFDILKNDFKAVALFGIFGMSLCQYTYFMAINTSNAGTATVLQYLAPILVLGYFSIKNKRLPRKNEIIAIICAVTGTFLLATHGNIKTMAISTEALVWGLAAAVTFAIYTIQPTNLVKKYGSPLVNAWGMIIGGFLLFFVFQAWTIPVVIDSGVIIGMSGVIILGTVVSFTLFMEGVARVGAKKGSLYASVEPVSATVFAVIIMGEAFGLIDIVGFMFIISTIFILAIDKEK